MTPQALYLILGFPVRHSQSPAMHNAAFQALQLPAYYATSEVHPEALGDAIRGIRALKIAGANITLPHKAAVCALLDGLSPQAEAIGAVNTLYWQDGRLFGHNTDAAGLARSLQSATELRGTRITILGAGGAARAAVVGLAEAGAARIDVAARRPDAAADLVAELKSHLEATCCQLQHTPWEQLPQRFGETDILVQATSATLASAEPEAANSKAEAFAATLPLTALPSQALVTDLVYKPLQTSVLRAAHELGLRTVDGLGMLLHQGALAFEAWTGQQAPLQVMREALGVPGSQPSGPTD